MRAQRAAQGRPLLSFAARDRVRAELRSAAKDDGARDAGAPTPASALFALCNARWERASHPREARAWQRVAVQRRAWQISQDADEHNTKTRSKHHVTKFSVSW